MNYKTWVIFLIIAVASLTLPLVAAAQNDLAIATIWAAPQNSDGTLDFDSAARHIMMSRQGFVTGMYDNMGDLKITEYQVPEGNNVRLFTTRLADVYNNDDILLSVGGSTDESSMYAAMEMNYFNIPIIIPFGDGDLVSGTGSTFSMRMTPLSQNYSDYIGNLFPANLIDYINMVVFDNGPIPEYSIDVAVFFADKFNGHDTAVKITQQLMDNGMNIDAYRPFEDDTLYQTVRDEWNTNPDRMKDAEAVLILSEDHDQLPDLLRTINLWTEQDLHPQFIITGYFPSEVSDELASLDNLFMVRQKLDYRNCPSEITNRSEAMGYAAGYISAKVLNEANQRTTPEPTGIFSWFISNDQKARNHEEYLSKFRNNVYLALLNINEDIPCYGYLNFNIDEENRTQIEIVRMTGLDLFEDVDPSIIFYRMENAIREQYGRTGQ